MTRHSGQNEHDLPPQRLEPIEQYFNESSTSRGREIPVSRAKPSAVAQRFPARDLPSPLTISFGGQTFRPFRKFQQAQHRFRSNGAIDFSGSAL